MNLPTAGFVVLIASCLSTLPGCKGFSSEEQKSNPSSPQTPPQAALCKNVVDYGAVTTAGVDNASAFNAAIIAAGADGTSCVTIPSGTYDLSTVTIDSVNNITINCAAQSNNANGGTKLRAISRTTTMFYVSNVSGIWFRGCSWTSAAAGEQTGGSFLIFSGVNTSGISNFYMIGGYDPLVIRESGAIYGNVGQIRNWTHRGITFHGGQDHYFSHLVMDQDSPATATRMLVCTQSSTAAHSRLQIAIFCIVMTVLWLIRDQR